MSFLTQLSFPVSNKHGKCAFGALGPAPGHTAATHPAALSSALQRGVTAHHEVCQDCFLQALLTYSPLPLREPSPLHSTLFLAVLFVSLSSHSFHCGHLFSRSFQPVPFLHLLHLPLPVTSLPPYQGVVTPPYLIHSYCVCPSSLSQLLFHLPPASSPPSFKPARQSLLQQGRLISIANTQRPPQPDIILHLSVMNISHLPQEGFIQHGRVGRGEGNMVPQHKLGQHQQIQERALSHGNSMPRVSPSVSWVQDPSPGFSPRLSLGLEGRSVPSLLPHPPQFPVR